MLGGGLERHFRILFSAIFQGVSLGNFHQGRNLWKVAEAEVWSILVNPRTFFMCVLIILYPFSSCGNPAIIQGLQSSFGKASTNSTCEKDSGFWRAGAVDPVAAARLRQPGGPLPFRLTSV